MDREAAARAIVERARQTRTRPARWVWIVAAIVSVACVGGLGVALVVDGGTAPRTAVAAPATSGVGGGLGLGLLIGLGVGISIGSVIAARRR